MKERVTGLFFSAFTPAETDTQAQPQPPVTRSRGDCCLRLVLVVSGHHASWELRPSQATKVRRFRPVQCPHCPAHQSMRLSSPPPPPPPPPPPFDFRLSILHEQGPTRFPLILIWMLIDELLVSTHPHPPIIHHLHPLCSRRVHLSSHKH
ncbi:hypothetical protein BO99DRAFT_172125 [Aspergillus violaceofuscus CBS 115571]|uniref:Uncharacterized protein n=1 Tax=Aspergillus violaceofuscus (strain CBS 115571) TaxID=1450538 RepID=A0A2V5H2X6_ASPV1|nr:hypothetical protein BO99DRAFT_172125 [Aspergillus violaceofuscus CBS 115571]